jgi:hypothetical protein
MSNGTLTHRVSGRLGKVGPWAATAAANNAAWCDLVCRAHGIRTELDAVAWTSATRTPALYPDAVTLVPDPAIPDLLDRIDPSPGCSIKDSFASMDLASYGFEVLFDAEWIVRTPTVPLPVVSNAAWTVVRDDRSFAAWEIAWRGEHGPSDVLRPDLLRDPSVTVLGAETDRRMVAGAMLCHSAGVVGISNVFADDGVGSGAWPGCVALASALFPRVPFVGYESGDARRALTNHGFDVAGPLRVWMRAG